MSHSYDQDLTKKRGIGGYDLRSASDTDTALVYDPELTTGKLGRANLKATVQSFAQQIPGIALFGVYDYNDAATAVTPINAATPGTWYTLTNDKLGANTLITYGFPGVTTVWSAASNAFDFSGLSLGDTVDIRVDIVVTTTVAVQEVSVHLFVDDDGAGEYEVPVLGSQQFAGAGANSVAVTQMVYMGNNATLTGNARLKIKSDAACTVVVNGWAVRVIGKP